MDVRLLVSVTWVRGLVHTQAVIAALFPADAGHVGRGQHQADDREEAEQGAAADINLQVGHDVAVKLLVQDCKVERVLVFSVT